MSINPISSQTPFETSNNGTICSQLQKALRFTLAILLVIITLGIVLCFTSFKSLYTSSKTPLKITTPPIPLPPHQYEEDGTISFGPDITPLVRPPNPLEPRWWYSEEIYLYSLFTTKALNKDLSHSAINNSTYSEVNCNSPITSKNNFENIILPSLHLIQYPKTDNAAYLPNNTIILDKPDFNSFCWHHYHIQPHDQFPKNCRFTKVFAFSVLVPHRSGGKPNHWNLIITNTETRELLIFDSKSGYASTEAMDAALQNTLQVLGKAYPTQEGLTTPFVLRRMNKKILQGDSYRCGPWLIFLFEKYLENPHQDFDNFSDQDLTDYLLQLEQRIIKIYPSLSPEEQKYINLRIKDIIAHRNRNYH